MSSSLLGSALIAIDSDKPNVPRLPRIDLDKEQRDAIEANLDVLPEIQELARQFSSGGAQIIKDVLREQAPEFDAIEKGITDEILSALRGELPQDVQDTISRRASERGISTGTAGSQFADFKEVQSFGLNSLQRVQQGLNSASAWLNFVRTGIPVFQQSSMFISPMQRAEFKRQQNLDQFQRNWLDAQVDAMPHPGTVAFSQSLSFIAETFLPLAAGGVGGGMGAAGGMMGGGTGAPAGTSISAGGNRSMSPNFLGSNPFGSFLQPAP